MKLRLHNLRRAMMPVFKAVFNRVHPHRFVRELHKNTFTTPLCILVKYESCIFANEASYKREARMRKS